MILILGGTAAYHLDLSAELGAVERIDQETPYGRAFPILRLLNAPGNTALAFASRHGLEQLDLTPPFVNARANLWAAHALGVQAIVSWNGVGAINPLLEVGDLLVLNHLLDMTRTRVRSFDPAPPAADPLLPYQPAPATLPLFDPSMSSRLYQAARATTERAFARGTYICSEGPRLETAAEIHAFHRMGADVVGMTLVPEVFLARELGMAFAALACVTNYATGCPPVEATAPTREFGVAVARRCLRSIRDALGSVEAGDRAASGSRDSPLPRGERGRG